MRLFFIRELTILLFNAGTPLQVVEYFMNAKLYEIKKIRNEEDPKVRVPINLVASMFTIHLYFPLQLKCAVMGEFGRMGAKKR